MRLELKWLLKGGIQFFDITRNTHDIRLELADPCEKQCQIIFTRNGIRKPDNNLLDFKKLIVNQTVTIGLEFFTPLTS